MYKVNHALTNAYQLGPDSTDFRSHPGPDMPHVTVNNKRMTNVNIGNGQYVQGIRTNQPPFVAEEMNPLDGGRTFRPLRYTPGLTCDPQLENLRPERDPKHPPIQGGENWRRKLIQAPQTYDGSLADADMEMFRPMPNPHPCEDPWYASRLPEQTLAAFDRLSMPASNFNDLTMNAYFQMHPQDELSRIKMRNRRFLNACAQENSLSNMAMFGVAAPTMMMARPMPSMAPQPTMDFQMAQDELSVLDQELNMTRRTTRPFVPLHSPDYFKLQRQVQDMEQPIDEPKIVRGMEPLTSVEQLPMPKRSSRAPATEAIIAGSDIVLPKPEVKMADKIAMRSLVLSKTLPKIGGGLKNEAANTE